MCRQQIEVGAMDVEASNTVALVLAAGNHVAVVATDILHNLIMANNVVICKLSPINDYFAPSLR